MEFGLVFYPDGSGDVFGYVRYVLPNSSAASNDLQRGVIFNTIDGQQINETNYNDLLAPDMYTIGLATFGGVTIAPTQTSVTLKRSQLTEDPIHISQTLTIERQNVGYLMYSDFTRD